jgi:hypothetical protein
MNLSFTFGRGFFRAWKFYIYLMTLILVCWCLLKELMIEFLTYLLRTIDDCLLIEIIEFWILFKSSLNDESVSSLLSVVVTAVDIICTDLFIKEIIVFLFFWYNNMLNILALHSLTSIAASECSSYRIKHWFCIMYT